MTATRETDYHGGVRIKNKEETQFQEHFSSKRLKPERVLRLYYCSLQALMFAN